MCCADVVPAVDVILPHAVVFVPTGPLLLLKYLLLLPKEKHGVCDKMPDLTITPPYIHSRVDFKIFTMGNPLQSRP